MKLFVTTYFFFLVATTFGQTSFPIDSASGEIRYEKIVSIEDVSKAVLFDRVNVWLAKAFIDSKEVIQHSNQETGKILAKGNVKLFGSANGFEQSLGLTRFLLEINVRDNKARIVVNDLQHEFSDGSPSPSDLRKEQSRPIMKNSWLAIKSSTDKEINSLINSFESSVRLSSQKDW
jgi:hypothetical protein